MRIFGLEGFATRLWWVVGLLLALLAALVGEAIHTSWHQHEQQAVVETHGVARVLEGELSGLVEKLELALHTVASEQQRQLATPLADEREIRAYMAGIQAQLPDVHAIRIADAAGRITVRSPLRAAAPEVVAAQPHFERLRDAGLGGVTLSEAQFEATAGKWVVDFAHRVEQPGGAFAGAVIASVPIDRLVSMLAAGDVGPSGEVTLRGAGLAIVARHPPSGESSARDAVPPALRELVGAGEITGTFHAKSAIDGIERLYSYRRVGAHPLHVTVGRATAEYLGHWRRDMGLVALLAAVLFAVTLAATAMIDRAWRRQRRVAHVLEMQAHTDSLTGIANRRRFFEMAEAELARTRRYQTPLSLLMLDIDRFKEVNDAHGHKAGDQVLRQLALTCLEVLRNVDVVGRVGGEEFAILLPETTCEGAVEVAERVREAVASAEVKREEGVPLRITVSIGVSCLEADTNLDTLMSEADGALYEAKRDGRNRVRMAGGNARPAAAAFPAGSAP